MLKKISVVVPTHDKIINNLENNILNRISKLYSKKYDLFLAIPRKSKLNFDNLGFKNIYFDDKNFLDVHSFNRLCLSKAFYEKFINYEYILFHQLDSIVFEDNIDFWLKKKYSFIGGPSYHKSLFKKKPIRPKFFCNGGLSLRNVKDCIAVIDSKKIFINKLDLKTIKEIFKSKYFFRYTKLFFRSYGNSKKFNTKLFINNFFLSEDVFWTFFAKLFTYEFNLPSNALECAKFSLNDGHEFYIEKYKIVPFASHYYNEKNVEYLNKVFIKNNLLKKNDKIVNL